MAGTWDSANNSHKVYINGEFDSEGPQSGSGMNVNSQTTLKIAGQVTGAPRYFAGLIDEVAIYGRVLTEDEIRRDMEVGVLLSVQASGKLSTTWAEIKTQY